MSAEPATPFGRRREVSSPSARALLLTILGEFALPRHAPVWTATVLEALALCRGVSESHWGRLLRECIHGLVP